MGFTLRRRDNDTAAPVSLPPPMQPAYRSDRGSVCIAHEDLPEAVAATSGFAYEPFSPEEGRREAPKRGMTGRTIGASWLVLHVAARLPAWWCRAAWQCPCASAGVTPCTVPWPPLPLLQAAGWSWRLTPPLQTSLLCQREHGMAVAAAIARPQCTCLTCRGGRRAGGRRGWRAWRAVPARRTCWTRTALQRSSPCLCLITSRSVGVWGDGMAWASRAAQARENRTDVGVQAAVAARTQGSPSCIFAIAHSNPCRPRRTPGAACG